MAKKNDISLALDELKKCGETLIALSEAMRGTEPQPVPEK
jgi:hypothetical protein